MTDNVAPQSGDRDLGTWLYAPAPSHTTQGTVESQPGTQAVDTPLSMGSIGRTTLGLVVIIAIILICMLLLKRFGPYKRLNGRAIKLIAGQSIGPRERVVIVEVDDTWLVLGTTQHNINLLHKLPAQNSAAEEHNAVTGTRKTPTFTQALAHNLRQATTRRAR